MKQMWLSTVLLIALVVHIPSVRSQTDNPNQPSNQTQAPKAASYWVTMPDSLRPGQQLHLTVQILSGQDPVTVNLAITYSKYINPDNTLKTVFTSSDYEVLPGDARTIPIDIPRNLMSPSNIWRGFYTVIVTGHGRTVNFSHNRSVSIFEKSASVLIATDKGIYKPGQTVNFRVFVMDSNLKVLIIPMDIFIKDPKNNIIKQYLRVNGSKLHGVFQDSFQLADSTMKGDWTMNVATDQAHDEMRTFTVDDYVIPNFEVQVETPAIPLSSSPSMPMKVKSMYTFGKPVTDGQVHVCITMNYIFPLWDFGQVQNPKIDDFCLDGKLNRDGEFTFQVTNQQLLAVVLSQNPYANDISYQTFKVEANVTETTTQRMQTGSSVMQIYFSPLTVQFLTVSKTSFKPGLASTAYLEVKKVDGTALSAQEIQNIVVNFNVTYEVNIPPEEQQKITDMPHGEEQITTNTPIEEEQSITNNSNSDTINIFRRRHSPFLTFTKTTRTEVLKLDAPEQSLSETGIIPITFYAPPDAISIAIVARCKKPFEDNTVYYFISKYNSPSNTFMQLSAPLKTPDIGDIITLTAESSELVKKFTYQVISKGMLVRSGTVTSPTSEGSKTMPFDLEITQAMAPTVQVLIFYIREQDSEFVGDAIALSVNGLFQKKVSFKFSKEQVEPGEPVDLIIKSEPGSTVYYSAIDKSVELLKTGNDVTVDLVRNEQLEYDYGVMSAYSFFWGWPNYYHGKDISSVFQESKVLIFSDGNVYKQPIRLYDDGIVYDSVEGIDRYTLTALQPTDNPAQGFLPAGKVRNNFIETWFFNFTVMPSDSNGEIVVPLTSPDTITKYIARIFSIDQDFGLSVGSEVASVTIFRKLFVSLDLPAVIIRYENFCFTASVFSYYQKQIPLLLTLEKSASYNGTYVKRDGNTITETSENIACTEYHGDISANEVRSSMFCFTPIVLGNIKLKVSVLTTEEGLSDAVEHVILSKPEGVTYSSNYPSLANLSSGFWQNDFDVAFPSNTVDGSQKLTVSISGNLMSSVTNNIENLLTQPYGCGEQNLMNLAPDIYLLKFLLVTGTATDDSKRQAKEYIEKGLQTQLQFEHYFTGGYSAFGKNDKVASLWLTSAVARVFAQLARLNNEYGNIIDANVSDAITRATLFMIYNQNKNGSFTENGIVFHPDMQGGSAEGEALTSYALISLVEAVGVTNGVSRTTTVTRNQKAITLAADYLASRISFMNDPFVVCITTYALHLAKHQSKDSFFNKMEQIAINEDVYKYWESTQKVPDNTVFQMSAPTSALSIEATSYALLTYILRDNGNEARLPILRWLISKRNPNGGFISTQDTIVCLEALSRASVGMYKPGDYSAIVTISYSDADGKAQSIMANINKENENILQRIDIPHQNNAPSTVFITANTANGGSGPSTVIFDVGLQYNIKGETLANCFKMWHILQEFGTRLEMTITIMALSENATSMSILDVEIAAGYTVDLEEVATNNSQISRVDPYNGKNLIMYFNSGVVNNNGSSVTFNMYATSGSLTKAYPRSYTFYDYYFPNCRQTNIYTLDTTPTCTKVPKFSVCPYVK